MTLGNQNSTRTRRTEGQTLRRLRSPCITVPAEPSLMYAKEAPQAPRYAMNNIHKNTLSPSLHLRIPSKLVTCSPSQPHIPEEHNHKRKEAEPHLPPHTRLLRHPQHAIHRPLKLRTRIPKLIIHLLRQGCRVADFVSNAYCDLVRGSALASAITITMSSLISRPPPYLACRFLSPFPSSPPLKIFTLYSHP